MAWSWASKGTNSHKGDAWSVEEQPQSKRRRISDNKYPQVVDNDDDWGDGSLELTQAELDTLDVMASQVISQAPPEPKSKEESFVKPNIPSRSSANKSSSSSDSSLRPFSSSSSLSHSSDMSLSSHSSSNGHIERGGISGRINSAEALQLELDKKERLIQQAQDEKYRHDGEVKYLRESLHRQEKELEDLRAKRDENADRQKQINSEREKNLQLQVDRLTSQAQFKEREYQELQLTFQTLQHKTKESQRQGKSSPSPGIQAQPSSESERGKSSSPRKVLVKPSPPSKLKQQQQRLEDQVGGSQRNNFPTPSSFLEKTISSPPEALNSSKANTSTMKASRSTQGRVSMSLQQKRARRLKLHAACPDNQGTEVLRALIQPNLQSGKAPDPGLPSLIHAMSTSLALENLSYCRLKDATFLSPFKSKRSVLSTQDSSQTVSSDSSVQVVSVENFNLAIQGLDILLTESGMDKGDPRLKFLERKAKDDSSNHSKNKDNTSSLAALPPHPSTTTTATTSSSSCTSPSSTNSNPSAGSFMHFLNSQRHQAGAVLLLPMLCDYLHHYTDMIHSAQAKRGAAKTINAMAAGAAATPPVSCRNQASSSVESLPLSTGSSSSYNTSLDSLSSSVIQLLQEGRMYANSIEKHAISALRCLNILVQLCPAVSSIIVKSSPSTLMATQSTSAKENATQSKAGEAVDTEGSSTKTSHKRESGSEADDEKSTSSSEVRIILGSTSLHSSFPLSHRHGSTHNLMDQSILWHLLVGLAAEDMEDGSASPEAVGECLRLLARLAYNCSGDLQASVLEHIIDKGILPCAFSQTKHPSILLEGQRLCKALMHHDSLLPKLCSKSENCPLFLMYRLCSSRRLDSSNPSVAKVYIEHISFLYALSTNHRNGMCPYVINSCLCSEELVISVVLAIHKLFGLYTKSSHHGKSDPALLHGKSDPALLHGLLQAIYVLHSLAQGDASFHQHLAPLQLTYVRLLSRMAAVFKPLRSQWEWHVSALEELCDVEPELSESSQDSEGDDRMDAS